MVLAAGRGTRMVELTDELPKPMLQVRGMPILEHILRGILGAGADAAHLITGWKEEAIRGHFGIGSAWGASVSYSTQEVPDGTGQSLYLNAGVYLFGPSLFDYTRRLRNVPPGRVRADRRHRRDSQRRQEGRRSGDRGSLERFVEKPTSHTIAESQAMLRAAEGSGRTVQVGLHRRIGPHHRSGMDFIRSGKVGRIGMVRLFVVAGGDREEPVPNSEPPSRMNWDLWCGPAPYRPYNRKLTPGGWRNFMDYSNGTLGDWGVHWLDQVLWCTEEKHPRTVYSTGGRPVLGKAVATPGEATTDAPGTQVAVYQFESFTATWEHRRYSANASERHRIGLSFHGTKGVFHMSWRDGWTFYPRDQKEQPMHEAPRFSDDTDGNNLRELWIDFLEAIDKKAPPCGPSGSCPPVLPPAPAGDDLHEGRAKPFLGRFPGANARRSAGVSADAARIPSSLGISSDLSGTTKHCDEGVNIRFATTSCPPDVPVQRMRILWWQIGK